VSSGGLLYGVDISNLQGHPDTYRNADWYRNAQFVIVQAIEPPAGYPGAAFVDPETGKRGYTGAQLRMARDDGKHTGAYVWLWNGLADTRGNILARFATVPPSVPLSMRPWVDVEDATPQAVGFAAAPKFQPLRVMHQLRQEPRPHAALKLGAGAGGRQEDTLEARAAADQWAQTHGLPESGGYSGPWYESGYLDGWWPQGWPKWWAAYDGNPGSQLGGLVVAHQYGSTPVDLDVMLESEIVTNGGSNVTDEERQQMQERIDGLVNALGYIVGDVVKPLRRPTAAKYVKSAVGAIDQVAEQFGIAHS
jgi:hypothetical protein